MGSITWSMLPLPSFFSKTKYQYYPDTGDVTSAQKATCPTFFVIKTPKKFALSIFFITFATTILRYTNIYISYN